MSRLAVVALAAVTAFGADTVVITNARVFPISSAPVDKATIVITDGKITAVGTKVAIPSGARAYAIATARPCARL